MRRGFLCLACVAGRIIWEEAEIATSANDDHLNICFRLFHFDLSARLSDVKVFRCLPGVIENPIHGAISMS